MGTDFGLYPHYTIHITHNTMKLFLASIVTALSLTTAAPAEASTKCGVVYGMQSCITDLKSTALILVDMPRGAERITTTCSVRDGQYEWDSYGPNTTEIVHGFVQLLCSN